MVSERRNVVVIADEAHRSQYDFVEGFARHMRDALPNASFIGFTGTPIVLTDANTRAVFGDYISVYDIKWAVEDGATVPIYYESRLAELALDEATRPRIGPEFEEATEGEEVARKERLTTKWAQLEAVVGSEKRLALVARDIVEHVELCYEAQPGKPMVVSMSRRICVELHREIARLRPAWVSDNDAAGAMMVVMTGSPSDPFGWQPHVRSRPPSEALADRFRDPADALRIVLVRDKWLTGFGAQSLHTMYVDKPMRGHGLVQAIAREPRVREQAWRPGGGLAGPGARAEACVGDVHGRGRTALNQDEAVAVMLEEFELCCGPFRDVDCAARVAGTPAERLVLLPAAQEHVLAQEHGKERTIRAVRELSQAFALCVPNDEALRIRDEVGFFQAVQSVLVKRAPADARSEEASIWRCGVGRTLCRRARSPDCWSTPCASTRAGRSRRRRRSRS